MKKLKICIFFVLIFGLVFFNNDIKDIINGIANKIEVKKEEVFKAESREKDDFKVNISVNKNEKPSVKATITYIGKEEAINTYNGGRIFSFSVNQIDGDYENSIYVPLPLRIIPLIQNEKHEETFNLNYDELKPGTYEIKATAGFSTDNEKGISIPVSKTIKITKQPKMQRETKKVGDYQVGIYTNKDKVFDVKAKITYYGKEEYKDISHSNRVFELSIKQLDGDFEWKSTTTQEASGSSLLKAIPYEETFEGYNEGNSGKSFYDLEPGIYEFKATAIFTVNEKAMEMPVSTIVKIEKE